MFTKHLRSKLRHNSKLVNVNTKEELDSATDFLTKSIHSAFIMSCPGRTGKPKLNFWWNNDLQKLKLESRKLNREFRKKKGTIGEHNAWIALNKCKHKYTKEIREAKRSTWVSFCSQIEGASATSRLHKLMAKDPAKAPGFLEKADGTYTENATETVELLLCTHFPGSVKRTQEQHHIEIETNEIPNERALDVNHIEHIT